MILILAACGGGASHAEPEHEHGHGHEHAGGEHEHPELPPDVEAFHDALAPIWHMEPGEGRAQAGCEGVAVFRERATALGDAALTDAVEALAAECDATGPEVETRLAGVHDAYHAVAEQHAAE